MAMGQKPTEILREEHQGVLQRLDALEQVIGQLDSREAVSSRLKELASFFETEFWIHFSKEEEALFPEIERFIPRDGGPTGVMLAEHEDLRNTNAELQPAIASYLRDSSISEAAARIQRQGTHFIEVLRDHIDKENNILFMMADMHLDEAQLEKVGRRFREIEGTRERR